MGATQKGVTDSLKQWLEAEDMDSALKAAKAAATEFDQLYAESATNLLARTPDLLMLLGAFQAGREFGVAEETERRKPVQEGLSL